MISQTAVTSFYTDEEQEHLKPILVLDTSVLSPTPFSTTLLMSILPNSFLSSSVHFLSSELPRTPTECLLSFLKLYFASKPYFYSSKYVLSSSWPLHLICTKNTSSPLSYLKAVSCDFFVSFRRGPLSTHFTWSDTDVSPIFLFSPLFGRSCIICVIQPSLKLSFTPLAARWEFIFTSCLCLRGTLSDCHSQHPLQGINQSQGVKSCPAGCAEFICRLKTES